MKSDIEILVKGDAIDFITNDNLKYCQLIIVK